MPPADDLHDLARFVAAQDPVYPGVLAELRRGRKVSHWMWFVFPQRAGLGHSSMARRYAIHSDAEARAYLAHPVLGPRLRECTTLAIAHPIPPETLLGAVDALKFRSCMELFDSIAPNGVFAEGLAWSA